MASIEQGLGQQPEEAGIITLMALATLGLRPIDPFSTNTDAILLIQAYNQMKSLIFPFILILA